MTQPSRTGFAWGSALTILLGAFLLFQVQPVISKMILPWFGGGPAVWTACMLFFQVLLLAGYAYAHLLASFKKVSWQVAIHASILLVAAATLPITPDASWKPADSAQPTLRILSLLLFNVGLAYFALSATSPLVQAWFSRVCAGRSPYRLYALSNVGSLGALLTYPFLFEPAFTTQQQGFLWSVLFAVFALLCGGLALATHFAARRATESDANSLLAPGEAQSEADLAPISHRLAWLALPALASVMLLAVTNHVCQDIAVVPFFWVAPLSLYLLSFIICFDRDIWYRRRIFALLAGGAALALCLYLIQDDVTWFLKRCQVGDTFIGYLTDVFDYMDELMVEACVYLVVMFLACMLCHGELVRLKPPPRQLTRFYLMVSAGGALGGVFVALIGPQVFSTLVEIHIAIVAVFMLAMGVFWDAMWGAWLLRKIWRRCLVFLAGFGLLIVVVRAQFVSLAPSDSVILTRRNFYGVLSVKEKFRDDSEYHIRELMNGSTLHGSQFQNALKSRLPTTYYNAESGIGLAMVRNRNPPARRIGVVGLGTGTLAVFGRPGQSFFFYEINPLVPRIAREQFSYITDTAAKVEILPGDARLTMERQTPQEYDLIALDAFSSDAIPAHLLTKEAFEQYFRHLRKATGIIAVHVSNRHLDLTPVVGGIAEHFKIPVIKISAEDHDGIGDAGSDWMLITHNQAFLDDELIRAAATEVNGPYRTVKGKTHAIPLWTDQYSNLFQILE